MPNKKDVQLKKTFGVRMREGRELSEFNIHEAANLLDIDYHDLKLIESCFFSDPIPLWVIKNASNVYDVSTDYLLGENDDWEREEDVKRQRSIGRWVHEFNKANIEKQILNGLIQQKKLDALSDVVIKLTKACSGVTQGLGRFRELNQEFDDYPGGSILNNRINSLTKIIHDCKIQLKRANVIPLSFGNNDKD